MKSYFAGLLAFAMAGFVLGLVFSDLLISTRNGGLEEFEDLFSVVVLVLPLSLVFGMYGRSIGNQTLWAYPALAFWLSIHFMYGRLSEWLLLFGHQLFPSVATPRFQDAFAVMLSYVAVHAVVWPARGVYLAQRDAAGISDDELRGYAAGFATVVALVLAANMIEPRIRLPRALAAAPPETDTRPSVVKPSPREPAKPYSGSYKRVATMKVPKWGVQFPLSQQTTRLRLHDVTGDLARFELPGADDRYCVVGPYGVMLSRSKVDVAYKKPAVELDSTGVGRAVYWIRVGANPEACKDGAASDRADSLQDALNWSQANMEPISGN